MFRTLTVLIATSALALSPAVANAGEHHDGGDHQEHHDGDHGDHHGHHHKPCPPKKPPKPTPTPAPSPTPAPKPHPSPTPKPTPAPPAPSQSQQQTQTTTVVVTNNITVVAPAPAAAPRSTHQRPLRRWLRLMLYTHHGHLVRVKVRVNGRLIVNRRHMHRNDLRVKLNLTGLRARFRLTINLVTSTGKHVVIIRDVSRRGEGSLVMDP